MKKYILYLFFIIGTVFFFENNVLAFDIGIKGDFVYNEEYIWEQFENNPNFTSENNNILCSLAISKSSGEISSNVKCYAFTDKQVESMTYSSGDYNQYWDLTFENGTYYSVIDTTHPLTYNTYTGSTVENVYRYYDYSSTYYRMYTNFNIPSATESYNAKINVLNFDEYQVDLNFNKNLFENDENFKKVCVDNNFSITKIPTDDILSESIYDFIWFPYGMSGIYQFNYSTDMSDKKYEFDDPYENFYFSSYKAINDIWTTEYMQDNFESKGYTDRYKYYGYTAYMFLHWYNFNDDNSYNFFPIFVLENPTITHISSSGNEHGGGGLRLDGDDEIQVSNEYCFYIRKEYEVNEVILDEWGDFYTNVNTPNGEINYGTTTNKDNANTDSFLSQPISFINSMKDTIVFINSLIYEFYLSLPLILRTFIITALILVIVMLVMRIGGYK